MISPKVVNTLQWALRLIREYLFDRIFFSDFELVKMYGETLMSDGYNSGLNRFYCTSSTRNEYLAKSRDPV